MIYPIRFNGILGQVSTNRKQVEQTFAKRWFLNQALQDWPSIRVNDPDSIEVPTPTVSLGELFQRNNHKLSQEQMFLFEFLQSRDTRSTLENHNINGNINQKKFGFKKLLLSINPIVGEDPHAIEANVRRLHEFNEHNPLAGKPKRLTDEGCKKLALLFDPRNGHSPKYSQRAAYTHEIVCLSELLSLNVKFVGERRVLHINKQSPVDSVFIPNAPDVFKLRSLSQLICHRLESPTEEILVHRVENSPAIYQVCHIQPECYYYPAIHIGMEKYESKNYYSGVRSNVLVLNPSRDYNASIGFFSRTPTQIVLNRGMENLMENYPTHVPVTSEPTYHPATCWGFIQVVYGVALHDRMLAKPDANVFLDTEFFGVETGLNTVFALCEFFAAHDQRLTWDWAPLAELWRSTPCGWRQIDKLAPVTKHGYWHLIPIAQLAGKFTAHKFQFPDAQKYRGDHGKNLMSVSRWPLKDAI